MGLFELFKITIGLSDKFIVTNSTQKKLVRAMQAHEYKSALEYGNKAVDKKPNSYKALYLRGSIHLLMGNYSEALNDAQASLNLKNNFAWSYYIVGAYHIKSENYTEAMSQINQGLSYSPKNSSLIFLKGFCYLCQDNLRMADDCFSIAYKKAKLPGHCNSILYLFIKNRFKENLTYIEKAKKLKYDVYGKTLLNYLEAMNSCMLGKDYSPNIDALNKLVPKLTHFMYEFTWIDDWLNKEVIDEDKRSFIVELNKDMKELKEDLMQ